MTFFIHDHEDCLQPRLTADQRKSIISKLYTESSTRPPMPEKFQQMVKWYPYNQSDPKRKR